MAGEPVLVCVILDESGSMQPKKSDVIGGFNNFLKDQQEITNPCRLVLTKFNTVCTAVRFASGDVVADVKDVPKLTEETYTPGGNTALYDAIAETVKSAEVARKPGEHVLCLIMTDGEENSSHETTRAQVKALIEAKSKESWTFLYIGEQPEKWAQEMGQHLGTTTSYRHHAPTQNWVAASHAAQAYRITPMMDTSHLMADSQIKADDEERMRQSPPSSGGDAT